MGITEKTLTVKKSFESKKKAKVNFMIDSGAVYSLVPSPILEKLGIRPYKKVTFSLADGTKVERRVGGAYFDYNSEKGDAPVIFGEDGDQPLLGATTLESLGLVLNPFTREL